MLLRLWMVYVGSHGTRVLGWVHGPCTSWVGAAAGEVRSSSQRSMAVEGTVRIVLGTATSLRYGLLLASAYLIK